VSNSSPKPPDGIPSIQEIGVHLTEGMMDPDASVSALVFHHSDCTCFSVANSANLELRQALRLDAPPPFV
jgi:hypothetical protein